MRHDPYDVRVAFDDIYERPHVHSLSDCVIGADLQHVTRNVLRRARRKRLAVPLQVQSINTDPTARSFQLEDKTYEVLGSALSAENLAADGFPIYAMILRCFQTGLPVPKLVRADTPASYARFRERRQAAHCSDLRARMGTLEALVSEHLADQHGGGRLDALEAAVARLVEPSDENAFRFGDYPHQDVLGMTRSPLRARVGTLIPVVRRLQGKVECWQDGDEICCTVRFLNPRGELRMATTGTPVQRHIDEALCSARATELECALPVLDRLAQILGSTALIPDLCRSVPILSTTSETSPMIGVMFAQSTPILAAAMALLQRCQQGDMRACVEVRKMEARGAGELLAKAADRLTRAQYAKARAMGGV